MSECSHEAKNHSGMCDECYVLSLLGASAVTPTPCPDCARKDALLGRAKTVLQDCVDELATIENPGIEGEDGRDIESLPSARTLLADIKEQA
jgi:hypothetical protein